MAAERYGSKTDVIVKLVLVFFIALLSFSIGTFVGKKFSDNQHKISQFESENNNQDRDVASIPEEAGEVKPKDALTDDQVAALAAEFVSEEGHPGKAPAELPGHEAPTPADPKMIDKNSEHHTEAQAEPGKDMPVAQESSPIPPAAHKDMAQPMKEAERVADGKSPFAEKTATTVKESRIPQSLPREIASSPVGKFTVQVAAYPTETEAQKVASQLKEKGFSAFYILAKVKDKTWYRVSVGLFSTSKEADTYKKELLHNGKVSSAMVQKITN